MIKGVIFDMDGVLVDNMEVHGVVFRQFCSKYGCRGDIDWTQFAGKGNDEIIPAMMPPEVVAEKGVEALGREKEAMYREYYAPFIEPLAGLVGFLKDMRAAGIKTAVGSSGEKDNVDFVLEKCGIAEYFDAVVNGDMVETRKPAPDIFLLAAKKLGLESSQCLVFEDSLSGMEAARRAGMKFIALTTTVTPERIKAEAKPEKIIADFTEISVAELSI